MDRDDIGWFLAAFVVAVGGFLLWAAWDHHKSVECEQYGADNGIPSEYISMQGCYVNDGQRWWELDDYRKQADDLHK